MSGFTTIGYTGKLTSYSVPTAGAYYIVTYGARGGSTSQHDGGAGSEIGGAFTLTAGEQLTIAVGGQGGSGLGNGGGGGGTFVIDPTMTPLVIAGGGGGANGSFSGAGGTTGMNGSSAPDAGAGGTNGAGGSGGVNEGIGGGGGGGGGFTSNGGTGSTFVEPTPDGGPAPGGQSYQAGSAGGSSGALGGGFGGGGAAGESGAGGGGGYSGGGGGGSQQGGGGGSFDTGTNQLLVNAENASNGFVFIAAIDTPTISGASASQSTLAGTNDTPFASFTLNDPNLGTLPETVVITDTSPGNGSFSDPNAATDGSTSSGGTITITGTAAQVQADLRALVFNPAAGQPGSQAQTVFNITATNIAAMSTTVQTTVAATTPYTISGTGITAIAYSGSKVVYQATTTGLYYMVAYGAQGGAGRTGAAGNGAEIGGEFSLTSGEAVTVAVGGQGVGGGGGGGGGGTFVVDPTGTPLVIAGGGGGGGDVSPATSGQTGAESGGGDNNSYAGSGGSFTSNGADATSAEEPFDLGSGGRGYPNGLSGGYAGSGDGAGGFGGGGGGGLGGGGGGGGFSGGRGGSLNSGGGGGGGSDDTGTHQLLVGGESSGNGAVFIARVDTPTITGTVAGQNSAGVGTPFSGVTIADPTLGTLPEILTVTESNPAIGTLRDPNAASDGSSVSNGIYTVTGTAAQITAYIDALVFTPMAGQYGTENFAIQVTNIAGMSAMDGNSSVVVPGVASAIANAQPAAQTNDETALLPFAGVTVTDANSGATDTLTVTPGAANGTLTATAGGTIAANGVFSVSGSASQVTNALHGLRFTPTAHQVTPGQFVTTTFALSDTNTALPGSAATASETVTANAVNDPPTITGTHTTQTSGVAAVSPFTAVAITDPDTGVQDSLRVTLSGAGGTLSGAGLTGSGSSYSLAATNPATLSAELDALSFTSTAVGTTTFTLQASQTAGGITASTSDMNTTVTVAALASVVANTQPTVQTNDETAVLPFTGVTVTDANPGNPVDTLTVTPTTSGNGTLTATKGGMVANGTFSVSGTAQQVTAALAGLQFTPLAHEVAPGQSVSTTFTISDSNTANPGVAMTASETVTAKAVNDAPTLSGIKASQTTVDYVAIKPFAAVTVADVDKPDGAGVTDSIAIRVLNGAGTATDANGKLSAGTLPAGATFTETQPGVYTLTAPDPAALTQALDGLTFTPTQAEAKPGGTITTSFQLTPSQTASGTTATGATATATVTTTALNYVNGPAFGFGLLVGTTGADVITAHGQFNSILGLGGDDFVNAGDSNAIVTLGNGNATVVLGGSNDTVVGGNGNMTVTGAPGGYTTVNLGNGNDIVSLGGAHDVVTIGIGTSTVTATGGMAFITTGSGNDAVTVGGSGNTINAGAGANTINATASSGNDLFVFSAASGLSDAISGFTETNGDVLDLRATLAATTWNHTSSTLANYLKVTDGGGNTNLAIASKGSGAGIGIATLTQTNYQLADLVSHHSLLT